MGVVCICVVETESLLEVGAALLQFSQDAGCLRHEVTGPHRGEGYLEFFRDRKTLCGQILGRLQLEAGSVKGP